MNSTGRKLICRFRTSSLRRRMMQTFAACFAAIMFAPTVGRADNYALLIGVSNYQDQKLAPLGWVANDVTGLAETLSQYGDYDQNHIVQIYDSPKAAPEGNLPTLNAIKQGLQEFLSARIKADRVIVYFSGHGDRDEKGNLYLLPIDYDSTKPMAQSAVDASWLRQQLVECQAGHKLFIVDSCHAGAGADTRPPAAAFREPFRSVDSVVVLTSCSAKEKSYQNNTGDHSVFTYWLMQALRGDADVDNDNVVTFAEAYRYVHDQVVAEIGTKSPTQTPVRFIGAQIKGSFEVTRLRPQLISTVIGDMARKIAWKIRLNGLGPSVGTPISFAQQSYAEQDLINDSTPKYGMLRGNIAEQFRQALATQPPALRLTVLPSNKIFSLGTARKGDVVIKGEIVKREGRVLNLRAKAIRRSTGGILIDVGGSAIMEGEELGELGVSYESNQQSTNAPPTDLLNDIDKWKDVPDPWKGNQHLLQESNWQFPFRIWASKDREPRQYEVRPIEFIDGKAYVALSKGEVFDIEVGNSSERRVFLKLFVDGIPVREPKLRPGVNRQLAQAKGVEPTEVLFPKTMLKAQTFLLNPDGFRYRGYYWKEFHREFNVVDSVDSLAARRGLTNRIGLISAGFYEEEGELNITNGNGGIGIGVAPGKKKPGGLNIVKAGSVGPRLGFVHINFRTPEELRRLKLKPRVEEMNSRAVSPER